MKTLSEIAREQNVSRSAVAKWLTKAEEQFGPIAHTQDGNRKRYSAKDEQTILSVAPKVANQFESSCKPVVNQIQNQFAIVPSNSAFTTDTSALASNASATLQDALSNASTLTSILATKVQLMGQHAQQRHGERCNEVAQAAEVLEQLRDVKANADSLRRIERDRDIHQANQVQALAQEIGQLSQDLSSPAATSQQAPAASEQTAKK